MRTTACGDNEHLIELKKNDSFFFLLEWTVSQSVYRISLKWNITNNKQPLQVGKKSLPLAPPRKPQVEKKKVKVITNKFEHFNDWNPTLWELSWMS